MRFVFFVVSFLCVFVAALVFVGWFRVGCGSVLPLGVCFGVVSAPPPSSVGGWLVGLRGKRRRRKIGFLECF